MTDQAPLLHIGYPKCLSTWLQQCLFRAEFGFSKPLNPFDIQLELVSHNPLDFDHAAFRAGFLQRSERAAGEQQLVPVCSSENLVGALSHGGYNARCNADKLHACFPEGRVLIVIREQQSMLRSLYRTLVAWGNPYGIERLLNSPPHWRHIAPAFQLEAFEYHRLIAYYQQKFGAERVKVLCFEQFRLDPNGFAGAILDYCELPAAEALPVDRQLNPGSSLFGIEKKRLANRAYRNIYNSNGLLDETEQRQYQRMADFRGRREGLLDRLLSPAMERRFRKRVATQLEGRFRDSNARTQALTGLPLAELGYDLDD